MVLPWCVVVLAVLGGGAGRAAGTFARDTLLLRNAVDTPPDSPETYAVRIDGKDVIECPYCGATEWSVDWEASECPLKGLNGKLYKHCKFGIYMNELCGNKLDCYSGPNEKCTEKMEQDTEGKRCARGYKCDGQSRLCKGVGGESPAHHSSAHYIILNDNWYQLVRKNANLLRRS